MSDNGSPPAVDTVHRRRLEPRLIVAAVDVGAAVVTAMVLLATGFGLTGIVRTMLALVFVSFVPGWALLDHVHLAEGTSKVALAVALSLSICTAGALTLLLLRIWQPFVLLYANGTLSLIGVLAHLARQSGSSFRSSMRRQASPAKGSQ